MKDLLVILLSVIGLNSYSQKTYTNKDSTYSFVIPEGYTAQPSSHIRNEFVFTNKEDTTSLVVNINESGMTKKNIIAFKKTRDSDVELSFFSVLSNPKIAKRGELNTYPEQTIYFHVNHSVKVEIENDYMMTYLFYHKGKEINFIFRTKARRLPNVSEGIDAIVNSVKLL